MQGASGSQVLSIVGPVLAGLNAPAVDRRALQLGYALTNVHVPSSGDVMVFRANQTIFQGYGPLDVNVIATGTTWTHYELGPALDTEDIRQRVSERLAEWPVVVAGVERRDAGVFIHCRYRYDPDVEEAVYRALEAVEGEYGIEGELHLAAAYEPEES